MIGNNYGANLIYYRILNKLYDRCDLPNRNFLFNIRSNSLDNFFIILVSKWKSHVVAFGVHWSHTLSIPSRLQCDSRGVNIPLFGRVLLLVYIAEFLFLVFQFFAAFRPAFSLYFDTVFGASFAAHSSDCSVDHSWVWTQQ